MNRQPHFILRFVFLAVVPGVFAQEAAHQEAPTQAAKRTLVAPVQENLHEELRQLRQLLEQLERRVHQLEAEKATANAANAAAARATSTPAPAEAVVSTQQGLSVDERSALDFWRTTTLNLTVDGYYGYNFNRPAGGVNLLRAYDVTSNSFNLNQATLVLERAPDVEASRRFGARVDLQFGQATETVQGNPGNEPRPQVYRNLWQAYGTYVAPLGKGLTVDFGKFAGALGYETKDNFNYSRAYFFNYLPFYHFGFRWSYSFNDKLTATHWLVSGTNQSEDFNGFKSQWALAGHFEYLSDRDGLFSGATQALKEHTLTVEYKVAEGFLLRGEYRRDYSNQPFFLTEQPGFLKQEQNTATLGLVWWFGRKQGSW